jgi:hypothetical protein
VLLLSLKIYSLDYGGTKFKSLLKWEMYNSNVVIISSLVNYELHYFWSWVRESSVRGYC